MKRLLLLVSLVCLMLPAPAFAQFGVIRNAPLTGKCGQGPMLGIDASTGVVYACPTSGANAGTWVAVGGSGGGGCSFVLGTGANQLAGLTVLDGSTICITGTDSESATWTQSHAFVSLMIFSGGSLTFTNASGDRIAWTGNDGRLYNWGTFDGSSQNAGPMVRVTGSRFQAPFGGNFSNVGITSPSTAAIYVTSGSQHLFRDVTFTGTLADNGFKIKPNGVAVDDVTVDHMTIANLTSASALEGIWADDTASSSTFVRHFHVINSTVYAAGSSMAAMGFAFDIPGRSGEPVFTGDKVIATGTLSEGFHFFGVRYGTFDVVFDSQDNFFSFGIQFGDAYFNHAKLRARCGANGLTACVQFIDWGNNNIDLALENVTGSTVGFKGTTVSGAGQFNNIGPCSITLRALGTNSTGVQIDSGTAGFVTSDNSVACNISGDASTGQTGIKITSTTGAALRTHILPGTLAGLATGINIGASSTGAIIDQQAWGGTVTTKYTFAASTLPIVHDLSGLTFANIPANLGNGSMLYVSDDTIANPCAAAGTGAILKRLNGVNVCN